ncbi:fosmidomycin efflux pump [Rhodovastum atsumiense]|nr:MFS transporter [Rhodovastum atsumiense]CAH2599450.1 fosmidomycin efflux pump [Rhodovastum atsumiense]
MSVTAAPARTAAASTSLGVLVALSFCHMLNDMQQSLLSAIYPILKDAYLLDFGQIGLLTLTFQLTASLLQPVVGMYTDRRPQPYSLAIGMGFTLVGLLVLSRAGSFGALLAGAALVGTGSSVFHPESSRMARLASGGRYGFAQSLFQVGGNTGQALGPLLAAFIVVPGGQGSLAWFSLAALTAIIVLTQVGTWYRRRRAAGAGPHGRASTDVMSHPRAVVVRGIAVLATLMFSKSFYTAGISTFFTFYLIQHFAVPVRTAQIYLFVFLAASALGTLIGGSIGDRFGRRYVIWASILGPLPFTLMLPHVGLFWTVALAIPIGFIMSSAFSAILVYAQELVPGRVGLVSGVFFGLAFGLGGLGAALLGELADMTSIDLVYRICAWLPVLGLLTWFLPDIEGSRRLA